MDNEGDNEQKEADQEHKNTLLVEIFFLLFVQLFLLFNNFQNTVNVKKGLKPSAEFVEKRSPWKGDGYE